MTNQTAIIEVARGIGFTEGPVWTSWGELIVVSMSRGLVYGIDLAGKEVSRSWETGGGPNGLAEGPGGIIWVAQNGSATTVSKSPRPVHAGLQTIDGETITDPLTTGCVAPNDLVFGPDGLVWFTDSTPLPGESTGRVCTYDPVSGELRTRIEGIRFPNGLAFGLDPTDLYVADSQAHEIRRFAVDDENVDDLGTWAELPGGSPDGIAFDADGQLFVTAFAHDEVLVFDAVGGLVRTISTGEGSRPTNLCFAGGDFSTLVVTAAKGGRVARGRREVPWVASVAVDHACHVTCDEVRVPAPRA